MQLTLVLYLLPFQTYNTSIQAHTLDKNTEHGNITSMRLYPKCLLLHVNTLREMLTPS